MSVTARSVLSSALVGENPYIAAERVIEKLDAAGWEIVRKPRIPEPGLWGVVEAEARDYPKPNFRVQFVRIGECRERWVMEDGDSYKWDELIDPVLVREGVEL